MKNKLNPEQIKNMYYIKKIPGYKIAKILSCSSAAIYYHINDSEKQKVKQRQIARRRRENQHPFISKIHHFIYDNIKKSKNECKTKNTNNSIIYHKIRRFNSIGSRLRREYMKALFTTEDVINKYKNDCKCYLTGDEIDINKPRSYSFDHIIPRSRGGDNSLDNLGICTKQVNQSKHNMTPDEYINLCKKVLEHNGYTVSKDN